MTTSTGGHFDRGFELARRALDVDPAADKSRSRSSGSIELSGAHAAAAEQYAHYAAVRGELGIEPPPLDLVKIGKLTY